ncbi:MAG: SRPBCC family protein [Bacteroidetes bacterium]|nr:SRPBCC family protein [Bacteroidota bacterium]
MSHETGLYMTQKEINREAPAIAFTERMVEAPVDTVWHTLVDFGQWPQWNSKVSDMKIQGEAREGSAFVWKAGGSRITSTIEEIDAPSRIVWSGKTLGIRAIHVWEFEEKEGGTLVRSRESFEGPVPSMFRGMAKRMLVSTLERGMQELKTEAEARHRSGREQ